MTESKIPELECIEPAVGNRIFELSRPGADPDFTGLGQAHLQACAFCRQAVDLDERLAARLRMTRRRTMRPGRPLWLGGVSLATAAAAVVCMMTLTPRPVGPSVSIRGAANARFVRPVEGEVVLPRGASAHWTEIDGADSYRVRLSDLDTQQSWATETSVTEWNLRAEVNLVPGHEYRLVLSTVPADLLAPGGASVRFTAGSVPSWIAHRVAKAPPVAYGLLIAALALGIYAFRSRMLRV